MIKRKTTILLPTKYLIVGFILFMSCWVEAESLTTSDHKKNDKHNDKHKIEAQLNFIAQHHTSDDTWLAGELGRYDLSSNNILAEAQLSYLYKFTTSLSVKTHIQAQQTTESLSSNSLGLVELHLRFTKDIDWQQNISFTLGQFFLPISMENSQEFWESPYTIHFSSLNSWIGEEFRPIGLDSQYRYFLDNNQSISLAATVFGGNDSMGALLAYRGWSIGRQRSVLGDVLALPNLNSLADGTPFGGQRDDGTRPFGKDLDNRPGYALRSQFSSEQLLLSLAWIDNRGDRELHEGEYAWDTRFAVLGASWIVNDLWEVLAEASQGSSTMGAGPGVDIDFYSAYLMTSYLFDNKRLSLRLEQFGSEDNDLIDDENHDLGRAVTFGLFWQLDDHSGAHLSTRSDRHALQLGFDIIYLNSKRIRSTIIGINNDSESVNLIVMGNLKF
jgi:hypothetical protein